MSDYRGRDVLALREWVPALLGLEDSVVEALYSTWCDIGSCASWLVLDEETARAFERWLYASRSLGYTTKRLEFAESLLCAMAFDHGRDLATPWLVRERNGIAKNPYLCPSYQPCVFCDTEGSAR